MLPAKQVHLRTSSDAEPHGAAVDAALDEWRHNAADVLLIAATVVHLPVLTVLMVGYGALMVWWLRHLGIPIYIVFIATALFRTVDYRTRLLVFFVTLYAYSQVGLVTVPIFVLVLSGNRPAAVAVGVSATIVLSSALLWTRPDVTHTLGFDPSYAPGPAGKTSVLAICPRGLAKLRMATPTILRGQRT